MIDDKKYDFAYFYDLGLKHKQWSCADLHRQLKNDGVNIGLRSLQKYRVGESRPTVALGYAIFQALEIDASKSDVDELLARSVIQEQTYHRQGLYYNSGVHFRISNLSKTIDNDAAILLAMQTRIEETQPKGKASFNQYITDLVQKDIDEHVLPTWDKKVER